MQVPKAAGMVYLEVKPMHVTCSPTLKPKDNFPQNLPQLASYSTVKTCPWLCISQLTSFLSCTTLSLACTVHACDHHLHQYYFHSKLKITLKIKLKSQILSRFIMLMKH